MPLFGSKPKALSIKDVPDWEKAMAYMTEKTGEEYAVAMSPLPLGIFGRSEFEVLCDKQRHTMVYPRNVHDKGHFGSAGFPESSLDQLDVGFDPSGTGIPLVGRWKSFVNRKFVDAYVGCLSSIYTVPWNNARVRVRALAYKGAAPVFLASDTLSMTIAPHLITDKHLEPTGKYKPATLDQ